MVITVRCQKCTKETHHNVIMEVRQTLPTDVMKSLHILGEMYTAKCELCKSEVIIGIDDSDEKITKDYVESLLNEP